MMKKLLGVIVFTIATFTLFQNLSSVSEFIKSVLAIFAPIILGCSFAFLLNILLNVFENKVFKHLKKSKNKKIEKLLRPISLVSTILTAIGAISILLLIIIPELYKTVLLCIEKVPEYYYEILGWVEGFNSRHNMDIDLSFFHSPNIDEIVNILKGKIGVANAGNILGTTVGITSSVMGAFTNIGIGFVLSIYILAKKEDIGEMIKRIAKVVLPEEVYLKISNVYEIAYTSFSNFIVGQFTDAILLGTLCFVGMSIFRLPNAAVISITIGITALFPIVGPFIGEAIGFVIIAMTSPVKAVFFIVFILCLQLIDNNFIYPKIVGKSIGLPGLLVLSAVIIGGKIGGVLGILLGVPTASALYTVFLEWLKHNEKIKNFEKECSKITE